MQEDNDPSPSPGKTNPAVDHLTAAVAVIVQVSWTVSPDSLADVIHGS